MVHKETILKAIDDLNSQETPNIRTTAKKYNVTCFTLQHHFNGKIVLYNEIYSKLIILFTNIQELNFIKYINELLICNLHPTL